MRFLAKLLSLAREATQQVGPYLALEILLPGGTLIALLLFLYRRRAAKALAIGQRPRPDVLLLLSIARARCERALAWLDECLRRRIGRELSVGTAAQ
jgi:hypothetical protein